MEAWFLHILCPLLHAYTCKQQRAKITDPVVQDWKTNSLIYAWAMPAGEAPLSRRICSVICSMTGSQCSVPRVCSDI